MRDINPLSARTFKHFAYITIFCFFITMVSGGTQTMLDRPFTKENLFSALESGRLNQSRRKSINWYIEWIKKQQVNFKLSPDDEQKLRFHGSYLGKKGLDKLVSVILDNYRSDAEASTGKISGKILDERKPYVLKLGGQSFNITGETLRRGINLGNILSRIFNIENSKLNIPVKIYEENNRLLVDAEIYNEKQDRVCSIVRDEWEFNPNNTYDRNHSINAFEIVDGNLRPVLQIFLEDSNKIYVGGLFYTEKGRAVEFTTAGTIVAPSQDQYAKRLFHYPSRENPGKLEKANLPNFKEYDDDLHLSEQVTIHNLRYRSLSNSELKVKTISLIGEVRQLYQTYQAQSELDREKDRIPFEISEQIMKDATKAKSQEEKMKIMTPFKEQQERYIERMRKLDQVIIGTYREKLQLDVVLIRNELLGRLVQVPKRMFSPNMIERVFSSTQSGGDLNYIVDELQVLTLALK